MQAIHYLGIFALLLISAIGFSILLLLYSVLPKQEKVKMKSKRLSRLWHELTTDNVKLSVFVLIIAVVIFGVVSFFSTNSVNDFVAGIHVELFGILFDIVILVLLFNWISSIGDKKQRIERYENSIEDFRYWKSEEAKYRIKGDIKRLNKEGVTKINLMDIDISDSKITMIPNINNTQDLSFSNIKLDESRFLNTNFSNLSMPNSTFNGAIDHHSKFIECGLLNGQFKNCHLQGTNFSKAFLHSADFSGSTLTGNTNFNESILTHAKFNDVTIDSAQFNHAEVKEDFLDKAKNWNIKGKNVFLDYEMYSIPMGNEKFMYKIRRKANPENAIILEEE